MLPRKEKGQKETSHARKNLWAIFEKQLLLREKMKGKGAPVGRSGGDPSWQEGRTEEQPYFCVGLVQVTLESSKERRGQGPQSGA